MLMESIWQEIGVNTQHICETQVPGRYHLICDKQWLQIIERQQKISKFPIWAQLDKRAHPAGPLQHPWTRILVQTYEKQPTSCKVFPLPQSTSVLVQSVDESITNEINFLPLSYSQAVAFVANENFKNLWSAAYKKYHTAHRKQCKQPQPQHPQQPSLAHNLSMSYDTALKQLIRRVWHCKIISNIIAQNNGSTVHEPLENYSVKEEDDEKQKHEQTLECHANILPAIIAIETTAHVSVFFYPPAMAASIYDCITYSPAILCKNYNKSMFLIYQICQLANSFQASGLFLGDVRLHDFLMRDNLWLQLVPKLNDNLLLLQQQQQTLEGGNNSEIDDLANNLVADMDADTAQNLENLSNSSSKFDLKFAYDLNQFTLREYCEMWCHGQLSNYDYLTILNNASGRSLNNPAYHHIMPWVTDFTARNGANWRDLSKSKYRLNKGDIHLDLMFEQGIQNNTNNNHNGISNNNHDTQVPHHVSDFLSEITYFVYMARRTPQHILREHVRPIWVPAEYPVSIQRLQAWTPDECIPQFYGDAMIFKSIHEDLADLELPPWATCPEDFICKHREALESQHVSERLHHWIDLNFGYKLTGKAAIKSKNVCLSVVDQHQQLLQRGIVQLFNQPHPVKRTPSPWFGQKAPRLSQLNFSPTKKPNNMLNQRLAKSNENLTELIKNDNQAAATASFYVGTNLIELPKEYNPIAQLHNLENLETFFARTFPHQKSNETQQKINQHDLLFDDNINAEDTNSYTNQLFNAAPLDAIVRSRSQLLLAPNLQQQQQRLLQLKLAEKRTKELQVLGCLIIELFAMQRLRPLIMNTFTVSFEDRLKACRTVFELNGRQDIPKCLRNIVGVMLQTQQQHEENVVGAHGLPLPPSVAQMLEPIFSPILMPFSQQYYGVYALMRTLHLFDHCSTLLELHTHFNCKGRNECSRYAPTDRQRVLYERKISECKVMACCAHIGRHLLEPIAFEQYTALELLLPHFIELLTAEQSSILTAWHLFDPIAQALGKSETQQHLLLPIIKLYDAESFERGMISVRMRPTYVQKTAHGASDGAGQLQFSSSSSFKSRKSVKLYHHSFLLRLIVRFGLRYFLHNFITPLIEAVGGYKEPEEGTGFHYHSNNNNNNNNNKCVNSKNLYEEQDEYFASTVTNENDARNGSSLAMSSVPEVINNNIEKLYIEDVFSFDDDVNSDYVSNSGTNENKSLDSFDMRTNAAEEAVEETTPERLAISDIIYGITNQEITNVNQSFSEEDKSSNEINNSFDSAIILPGQTKSPTIEIPASALRRSFQLNTIDCDIGSRKSVDSFEIIAQQVEEDQQAAQKQLRDLTQQKLMGKENVAIGVTPQPLEVSNDNVQTKISEAKLAQNNRISEMSSESLMWLSHRLGPVLTCCYITRNLLKMLSLCYVGQENLMPEIGSGCEQQGGNLNYFSIAEARVLGDQNAARVLECLMSIAGLFGEEVILLQYFPHICELIALSKTRITGSLEGAIISTLQMLKCIVPCLTDATLMERLKDTILDGIILPVIDLLGATHMTMPNGYLGRSVLARKLLDALYVLCVRIGPDMSCEHLCLTALRRFFLIFNKAYGIQTTSNEGSFIVSSDDQSSGKEEMRDIFCVALAHTAYIAFLQFLGDSIMQRTLQNFDFILLLCHEFEQPNKLVPKSAKSAHKSLTSTNTNAVDCPIGKYELLSLNDEIDGGGANSFGSNVVGNRIEVKTDIPAKKTIKTTTATTTATTLDISMQIPITTLTIENATKCVPKEQELDMVAYKFESLSKVRHLRGNWLAYWRHEVSRPENQTSLTMKQIKLQSFVGHTNSVRAIVALDNENSFISASKDKTVKLWSLRSEGDGSKLSQCQFTYSAHKKSVHSMGYLEAMRFVASCDAGVHIWDPFIGRSLSILDSSKHNPVTVVKCMPSPSPLVIAGTTECSVKMLDTRCMQYVCDWRTGMAVQGAATVRCLCVAPSGNWLAVGLSSGSIVMLDTRTGMILNTWRPMECDLLQLVAPNDQQLISSALDHSLAVWHANHGILHYQLKPPAEPAHYLQAIDSELVFATTGNRIGIYADIRSSHAAYNVTKLRPETFRGVLTSLAVLPLNRTFLAGNESGNIVLLC